MGNLLPDTLGLLAGACAFALAFGIAFVAIRAYESFQKECFGNGGGGAALGVGESMLLGLVRRALLVPVSPVNARFVAKRFYAPVSTLLRRAGYPGEITALEVAGLMELCALVLGALAASDVAGREAALERRLGPAVPVVVARADLPAGRIVRTSDLAIRRVPARYAPAASFSDPSQAAGLRTTAAVVHGTDLAPALLANGDGADATTLRPGERIADLVAAGLLPGGTALEFAQPPLWSAVYTGIPPARRGALHARAVAVLADEHAPPERLAACFELARHFKNVDALFARAEEPLA